MLVQLRADTSAGVSGSVCFYSAKHCFSLLTRTSYSDELPARATRVVIGWFATRVDNPYFASVFTKYIAMKHIDLIT